MFDGLQHGVYLHWHRDLVQEHIAYKVWPLVSDWEMPKGLLLAPAKVGWFI
jgi:hypothetical protein